MILGDDTISVIWGYHPNKPKNKHHIPHHGHKRRGVRSLHLKEMPQKKIKEDSFTKTWDLRGRNVRLPNDDHTHYYCQIFKAPPLERKHHMIGVRFSKDRLKPNDKLKVSWMSNVMNINCWINIVQLYTLV